MTDQALPSGAPSDIRRERLRLARINSWRDELAEAWETPRRWSIIRKYYRLRAPEIESELLSPYELDLPRFFTPIEAALWQDIRGMGLPFYIQYPVGRRFVDFGDPRRCIAIEADGARWHDKHKDAQKDRELQKHGWRVIRVSGRDCFGEAGTEAIRELRREYFPAWRYDSEEVAA